MADKARSQKDASPRALREAVEASKAPAISRAAAILRLLSTSDSPLPLQNIAKTLDLVPSTCLHVLRALVAEDFVAFDSKTKRYSLEAGVLVLAQHWLRRNRFNDLIQPVLDRISRNFKVTAVGLRIASSEQSIVVAVSQGDPQLRLTTHVGSFFPAFAGATGRCLAANRYISDLDLHAIFSHLEWDNPPTFDEWLRQIEQTRTQGYAIDKGNYISGVTVVLVPVWEMPSELGHALIAFGIGDAVKRERLKALQSALLHESHALTKQLQNGNM